jgi:hypothetical protein
MLTKKAPKNAEIYECKKCDFKCSKQSDWDRHIATRKHENVDDVDAKKRQKTPKIYECICGNTYGYRQSLHIHKKKCTIEHESNSMISPYDNSKNKNNNYENMIMVEKSDNEIKALTSLVLEVVKNNQELQKQSCDFQRQMVDMCKNIQSNITMNNNCNNNNINTTFNMQVFLNEECKDAINMSDFVNSFDIQLEDLESVGILGYATGLSNIIVKELKLLDIYKRPIHCSDLKREVFYVKDNDVWEKETPENSKMKKAIKGITKKNMVKLNDWREEHPDCEDIDSSYNDIYMKLIIESCGGRGDLNNSENKILKNIAREVVIKK